MYFCLFFKWKHNIHITVYHIFTHIYIRVCVPRHTYNAHRPELPRMYLGFFFFTIFPHQHLSVEIVLLFGFWFPGIATFPSMFSCDVEWQQWAVFPISHIGTGVNSCSSVLCCQLCLIDVLKSMVTVWFVNGVWSTISQGTSVHIYVCKFTYKISFELFFTWRYSYVSI